MDEHGIYLPQEIWTIICSRLPWEHLRSVSRVSSSFHKITRPLLWYEPRFKRQIGLNELRSLSELHLPIKVMKSSQFKVAFNEEFVTFIASAWQLSSFVIDFGANYGDTINPKQFELCIEYLPVTSIDTRAFGRLPAPCYVDCLVNAKQCQELIINEQFHQGLEIESWRKMARLPIVKIDAKFWPEFIPHLEEYDRLVGCMDTLRTYNLVSGGRRLSARELSKFKYIRIANLQFGSLDESSSMKQFVDVLLTNKQQPSLSILYFCDDITLDGLRMLSRFTIAALHTRILDINCGNVGEFVQVIVDIHRRSPIVSFHLDLTQREEYFKDYHIEMIKGAGLI